MTTTIEDQFGARIMTSGGFLLNNELTDFSFAPEKDGTAVANRVEPGAGQVNGPSSNCAWEPELYELERALRGGSELEPPLPRWYGRTWRRQEDEVAKRLRSERANRITIPETPC